MKQLAGIWFGCGIMFLALSQPGYSQTVSFGDAVAVWAQACGKDVKKYCTGIKPGNNRMASCLMNKATTACQNATFRFQANMDARLEAQAKAPKICKVDIKRFCANHRGGQARVLRCLLRKDNFRAATRPCKDTLRAAGWLDTVPN